MWHITSRAAARDLASADRALERLEAGLRDHVLRHAHFDADRDVGILGNRLRRSLGLSESQVEELGLGKPAQSNVCDMHKGIEASACVPHDVAPKGREIIRARIPGGNHRGCALEGDQLVGGYADRGAVRIDVRVQINEPRNNDPARGVEYAQCARRWNVRLNSLYFPVAHTKVPFCAQALARVEQLATLDHQVKLVVRPHGGAHGSAHRAARCRRKSGTYAGNKAPAIL